jgi:hypothetical protein
MNTDFSTQRRGGTAVQLLTRVFAANVRMTSKTRAEQSTGKRVWLQTACRSENHWLPARKERKTISNNPVNKRTTNKTPRLNCANNAKANETKKINVPTASWPSGLMYFPEAQGTSEVKNKPATNVRITAAKPSSDWSANFHISNRVNNQGKTAFWGLECQCRGGGTL